MDEKTYAAINRSPELSYGSQDLASKLQAADETVTKERLYNQIRNKCNERLEECKEGTPMCREFWVPGVASLVRRRSVA